MENFDTEKIEAYLTGQLSPAEQKAMLERVAAEPDFAAAVALHQISIAGIERFGLQQVQEEISSLDKDLAEEGFFLTTHDLDAYLDKKAGVTIQQKIEQRLARDENFRKDFELHQLTRSGIEKKEMEAVFTDLFEEIDKDLEQEGFFEALDNSQKTPKKAATQKEAKIVRFPFRQLAIAASIALTIFAGWWVLQPTPLTPQEIFAYNFSPLPDELSKELEETGFVKEPYYDFLEEGITAYNNTRVPVSSGASFGKNYQKAIEFFQQYRQAAPTTDDFYPTATLYLAISHLALYETQQAIPLLESITQQNFPQLEDAKCYLALSYIENGQKEKAIPILKGLEQTNYQKWATKVIKDLD